MKLTIRTILVALLLFCGAGTVCSQQTIRILTIGNSFSEDAVENYLHDLGKSENITFIIGNMYIGGCDLQRHFNNANNNTPAYSYRKINATGVKTTRANTTIQYAVRDEQWDYISLQQVSQHSGMPATYKPFLEKLIAYLKTQATNPTVEYILHQTWAYAQNSTHTGFANYNSNQTTMYNAIVNAVNTVATENNISTIIPCGTAIQNGRTSILGDNFCRDGYHLSLGVGRYTAACTWFEKLSGKSVVGNTFHPLALNAYEKTVAQLAAHHAVNNPDQVTPTEPEINVVSTLEDPILIDFGDGNTASEAPWNNFTAFNAGHSIRYLMNEKKALTNISITLEDSFGGINPNGSHNTSTPFNMPASVTRDSFFGNVGVFNGKTEPTGAFRISNLETAAYDLHIFASRMGGNDNRETLYSISGQKRDTALLNVTNNTNTYVSFKKIYPDENGNISIKAEPGPNNNNSVKFYYIGALIIAPASTTGHVSPKLNPASVYVHPNPITNSFTIDADASIKEIDFYDILGRRTKQLTGTDLRQQEIDFPAAEEGMFFMILRDSSNNLSSLQIIKY